MLYFAYGSNLNKRAMARRCPDAAPVGKFFLPDARLVFRGVADCIAEPGSKCPGAVWQISDECEDALDRYEGIGSGFYRKEYLPIAGFRGESKLMLYVMNSSGVMPPSVGYLDTIKQGYRDFGLPAAPLQAAVQQAWDDKNKTFQERARHHRNGYPTFARPEAAAPAERKAIAPPKREPLVVAPTTIKQPYAIVGFGGGAKPSKKTGKAGTGKRQSNRSK